MTSASCAAPYGHTAGSTPCLYTALAYTDPECKSSPIPVRLPNTLASCASAKGSWDSKLGMCTDYTWHTSDTSDPKSIQAYRLYNGVGQCVPGNPAYKSDYKFINDVTDAWQWVNQAASMASFKQALALESMSAKSNSYVPTSAPAPAPAPAPASPVAPASQPAPAPAPPSHVDRMVLLALGVTALLIVIAMIMKGKSKAQPAAVRR